MANCYLLNKKHMSMSLCTIVHVSFTTLANWDSTHAKLQAPSCSRYHTPGLSARGCLNLFSRVVVLLQWNQLLLGMMLLLKWVFIFSFRCTADCHQRYPDCKQSTGCSGRDFGSGASQSQHLIQVSHNQEGLAHQFVVLDNPHVLATL